MNLERRMSGTWLHRSLSKVRPRRRKDGHLPQGGPEKSYFYNDSSLNNLKVRGRPLLFLLKRQVSVLRWFTTPPSNGIENQVWILFLLFDLCSVTFLFDSDLFQWPLVASITWCLLLVGKWRRASHRTCLTCLKLKCRPWKDYILLVYRDNLKSLWRLASDMAWMIQKSLEREITHEFN